MAPTSHRTPFVGILAGLAAAVIALTACGQTTGVAVPQPSAGTTDAGSAISLPGATTTDGMSTTGGVTTADQGTGGGYDQNRTVALDMSVRVVNLFIPKGSQQGSAIEVWAGSPQYGGKKLQTVAYGQVSSYFAPEVMDPMGQGQTDKHMDYTLSFYVPGKTAADDALIQQSENASPGQKLTMVVAPNEPSSDGASLQVFSDDLGSSPEGGGFHTLSIPKPPSGTAVLLLGALAMEYRGSDPNSPDSLTPSTVDGKCVQYIESDTGKVHDPKSDTTDLFGGTSSLPYVVQPGAQIRINIVKDQQSVTDSCASAPVIGPVDPKLAVGQRAYGFVWGPDMKTAQLLVVPLA